MDQGGKERLQAGQGDGTQGNGHSLLCLGLPYLFKIKQDQETGNGHVPGYCKRCPGRGYYSRCHFEDITRADIYGFVVPFAKELMRLSRESNIPVKIQCLRYYGEWG